MNEPEPGDESKPGRQLGDEWVYNTRDYGQLHLRDFFAAFALAGLISQSDRSLPTKVFAEEAYRCADAMIAQRKRR